MTNNQQPAYQEDVEKTKKFIEEMTATHMEELKILSNLRSAAASFDTDALTLAKAIAHMAMLPEDAVGRFDLNRGLIAIAKELAK